MEKREGWRCRRGHLYGEENKVGIVKAAGLIADKMESRCEDCDHEKITFRNWRCASCEGHPVPLELIGRAIEAVSHE